LIIALIWYVFTAYFSTGYNHADEHYQIIEFAAYKQGAVPANGLAWEFKSQMRPATQVAIAYTVFSLAERAGINDPYAKAFILRLITALLAVAVICFFTRSYNRLILPEYRRLFLILSFFIWFLPFLNVRFSSETWAGLMLLPLVALAGKEKKRPKDFIWMGILAGLSFLFRYQMAVVVLGILIWLSIIKKERVQNMLVLVLSGLLVILAGTFIDYWFYGHFVLVPWNYVKLNLLAGKASEFGTAPWYYYFYYVFRFAFFPVGIIIILSFLILIIKKFRSVFVWTVLPFVLVHSLIPHKELRFLFPLINLVAVMIVLAIQEIKWREINAKWKKPLLIIGVLLGLINLSALVVASVKPAGIGRINITKRIQQIQGNNTVNLITYESSNPYDPWVGGMARFYLPSGVHFKHIESLSKLDSTLLESNDRNLLVLKVKDVKEPGVSNRISYLGFKKVDQSIPESLILPLQIYGGFKAEDVLILYSAE